MFIALHGAGGEDAVICTGLLEMLGIALHRFRCGVAAGWPWRRAASDCARIWDYPPEFAELNAGSDWLAGHGRAGRGLRQASAGGTTSSSATTTSTDQEAAWKEAIKYGHRVIAERLIDGPEYTVTILGDEVLPAIRIRNRQRLLRLRGQPQPLSDETRYLCPCGLDADDELAALARSAFDAVGCEVGGRVDFMRDTDDQFIMCWKSTQYRA